jgi:4a-hydroxytetrahydrobiopterin dehydratase
MAKNRRLPLAHLFLSSSDYEIATRRSVIKQYKTSRTMSDIVAEDEIRGLLKKLPEWDNEEKAIVRVFEFNDYTETIDFVNAVAEIAEDSGHHPDMDIRWCSVTVSSTSHDVGGLTGADFEIAKKIDTLVD